MCKYSLWIIWENMIVRVLTWKVWSQSCRPEGGGPEVTRRRWAECPLASRRSPNVVGVAWTRLDGLQRDAGAVQQKCDCLPS